MASRASKAITGLLQPLYPNAKFQTLITDFSKVFAFHDKDEFTRYANKHKIPLPLDWAEVLDFSIKTIFPISNIFYGCPLLKVDPTPIPFTDFAVIVPNSPNDMRIKDRYLTELEWGYVSNWLEWKRLTGVILNTGEPQPARDNIIDLTGKTTISEAINITRQANAYIGVDSCLSVIASQTVKDIIIKSSNQHLYRWKHIYYAPRIDFGFIRKELK